MKSRCESCGTLNQVPDREEGSNFICYACGSKLTTISSNDGSTSAAVGMIGGAALGASIAGPAGAVIGGVLGAILGKESKGVG